MRKCRLLSIVIPCHNEQEALPGTCQRMSSLCDGWIRAGLCTDYEWILVDNGSTDQTLEVMETLHRSNPHIRIIALRRNFGFQGSLSAGLSYARGDAVVTIDADLQDPPESIEKMLGYYEQEYDLVLGVRGDRSTDSFLKRFFSENYYRLLNILGVNTVYNQGDFRLMGKELVREYNALSERNRFIRGMILQLESRYAIVTYKREKRRQGKSKFNVSSLFSFCLDGLVSFTFVPLRIAAFAGLFLCLLAVVGIGLVLWIKFTRPDLIVGWASILLAILGLSGFQLLVLGIIGEYIGRLYIEVKQRPLFVVRKEYRRK